MQNFIIAVIGALAIIWIASLPILSVTTEPKTPISVQNNPNWELLVSPYSHSLYAAYRAKTPNGWLVCSANGSFIFVPDPQHEWLK